MRQCIGRTRADRQCSRMVVKPVSRCWQHRDGPSFFEVPFGSQAAIDTVRRLFREAGAPQNLSLEEQARWLIVEVKRTKDAYPEVYV